MGDIKQYWIRRIDRTASLQCSGEIVSPHGDAKNGAQEFDYGNKSEGALFLSATLVYDSLQEEFPTIIYKFLDLVICEIHLDKWTITNQMIREFADYFINFPSAYSGPSEACKPLPKRPVWLTDLQNSLAIK